MKTEAVSFVLDSLSVADGLEAKVRELFGEGVAMNIYVGAGLVDVLISNDIESPTPYIAAYSRSANSDDWHDVTERYNGRGRHYPLKED